MSALLNRVGFALRETGQALDRLGCRLAGKAPFEEVCEFCERLRQKGGRDGGGPRRPCARVPGEAAPGICACGPVQSRAARMRGIVCPAFTSGRGPPSIVRPSSTSSRPHPSLSLSSAVWRHRTFQNLGASAPRTSDAAFIAPSASLVGSVSLGAGASVWPGAVLRGDAAAITVGASTNLQDGVTVRTAAANPLERAAPITLGDRVTVGHGAALGPGVRVGDGSLVGMGATLGAGSVVEAGAMVAAGAVVEPGTVVASGQLWGGVPARLMRALKKEEAAFLPESAARYESLGREYAAGGASAPTRG